MLRTFGYILFRLLGSSRNDGSVIIDPASSTCGEDACCTTAAAGKYFVHIAASNRLYSPLKSNLKFIHYYYKHFSGFFRFRMEI